MQTKTEKFIFSLVSGRERRGVYTIPRVPILDEKETEPSNTGDSFVSLMSDAHMFETGG